MGPTERQYDVDWVRVVSMMAVFIFHVMMYFNAWSWHAKNTVTSEAFQPANLALLAWIMPIFFMISGFATHQALNRHRPADFLKERLLRLGVPILACAFLLSPFQVYSERVTYGQFSGTFLAFLPHYFDGWYSITPGGNFAWMGLHMWFLVVLLVWTFLTLPFFVWARSVSRPAMLSRLEGAGPAGVLLLIPTLILGLEWILYALGLDASQSGWPFGVYLADYVIGYALFPREAFRTAVRKLGLVALVGAIVTTIPVAFIPEPEGFSLGFMAWHIVRLYNCWLWIMGLFYLGQRYLNRNSPALQYANEAVMPFYVLHQPVIVALGFFTRTVPMPVAVKFPLLMGVSFAVIMALYHFVVRPVNLLRFLVGMSRSPLRTRYPQ